MFVRSKEAELVLASTPNECLDSRILPVPLVVLSSFISIQDPSPWISLSILGMTENDS